jgi:23S rRNA (cytosine1962-C5)-methyltransferase
LKPAKNRKRGNRQPGRRQPSAGEAAQRPAAKPVGVERQRPAFGQGTLPVERLPVILEVGPDENYALIDSGDGEKLERFGEYRVVRPEGQAIWPRALPQHEWQNADAVFTGDTDEEGLGRWRFPKQPLGETWPMRHDGIDYLGRFTSFRHVGVFPEQASHWRHMAELIGAAGRPVKVLNLFGYTGLASLVAAEAGAEVTHVDASKKAIGWARENQAIAQLENKPVRWICEDAKRFAEREVRRGNRYDIILLDPPAFGRGPKGEVWQLFEDLPAMVALCREILSEKALAMVLTAYAVRSSFFSIHGLLRGAMAGKGGAVESGELIIREETAGRALSTSMFTRWVAQ